MASTQEGEPTATATPLHIRTHRLTSLLCACPPFHSQPWQILMRFKESAKAVTACAASLTQAIRAILHCHVTIALCN